MNRFFTLLLAAFCLTAVGQVTYPYNPDEDGNGQIAVGDLQGILATYGNEFSPSEILVDGETLTTVLTQLQNSIDSLSGLGGGGGSVLDMPLGTILPIATESVPEGWMLCDGREIAIEEYQGLYDLIGTTYGAGDSAFWAQVFYPATTFNIPDLRGRTIIGANDMGGEQSDVLTIHQASAGQIGGEEMHQLTEEEMPNHTHGIQYFRRDAGSNSQDPWNGTGGGPASMGSSDWRNNGNVRAAGSGGDQPHNNMQPYMALNYMMKVQAAEDVVAELEAEIISISNNLDSIETVVSNGQQPIFSFNFPDGISGLISVDVNLEEEPYVVPDGYNLYVTEFETRPDDPSDPGVGIYCDGYYFIDAGCGTVYDDGFLFAEGMDLTFTSGIGACSQCSDCASSSSDYCFMKGFLVPKKVDVFFQAAEMIVPDGYVFVKYNPSQPVPRLFGSGQVVISPRGYLLQED